MSCVDDWECIEDLAGRSIYPDVFQGNRLRSDIILHSEVANAMFMIQLTVPHKSGNEEVNNYKTES